MPTESGFSAAGFGDSPWGDGDEAFRIVDAEAWRENVIRVLFGNPVFFNGLVDAFDAGDTRKYSVAPIAGSKGIDGEPARAVSVIGVSLVRDDAFVLPEAEGYFLDLTLDRPFTPWPALYTLTMNNVYSEDKTEVLVDESVQVIAVYRELTKPVIDEPTPSRDIANPQTLDMMQASLPRPHASLLATYSADDTGDYAFDQGMTSLKKRLYRRIFTRKGTFAHLPPGYGLGIQDYAKQLGTAAVQSRIATDAEAQFSEEPEVAKCRVVFAPIPNRPGGWYLRSYVKTKTGVAVRFDFQVG